MNVSDIKPFEAGENIQSPEFRQKLNNLVQACRSNIITKCIGGIVRQGRDGTTLEIERQSGGGGASASSTHPFKIFTRTNPDDSDLFQARVELQSDILKSILPTDKLNVTGLNTWFSFIAEDLIWVDVTTSGFAATAATIKSYGHGDSNFVPSAAIGAANSIISMPAGIQTGFKIVLGYSHPDDDGNPGLVQTWSTHILLSLGCAGLVIALYDHTSPRGSYS